MPPFGVAGGGYELADHCFFIPAFAAPAGTILNTIFRWLGGQPRPAILLVITVATIGAILLLALAKYRPTTDPDEVGSEQMFQALVCWWLVAACFIGLSAGAMAIRHATTRRAIRRVDTQEGAVSDRGRDEGRNRDNSLS
jgi:hypothetical protein